MHPHDHTHYDITQRRAAYHVYDEREGMCIWAHDAYQAVLTWAKNACYDHDSNETVRVSARVLPVDEAEIWPRDRVLISAGAAEIRCNTCYERVMRGQTV